MDSPLFRLHNLLISLFQPEELRIFVHLRVDESLVHCLPVGEVSWHILAYRACVAFEQRGHIGPGLFALLIEEFPLREADIREVETTFQTGQFRQRVATEVQVRNLEKTLELLDRTRQKVLAGDTSPQVWKGLAMLMTGITAILIWKHYFNDQTPADIMSDQEAQDELMAEAQVASSYGRAYLEVTSYLLEQ